MYDLSLSPVTVITMDKFSQHSAHRPTEVTLLHHTSNPIPQRLNPPNGAAARAMNFMLFCDSCKSSYRQKFNIYALKRQQKLAFLGLFKAILKGCTVTKAMCLHDVPCQKCI